MNNKPKSSGVIIYTDGACAGNPGPGGWGALLQYNGIKKEILGYDINTTNNRMEVTAAIEALKCLKKRCEVEIYTDSKYLQQGITNWIKKWIQNNYKNGTIKNIDLWKKLYSQIEEHDIIWHWVKGHSDNAGNIIADKLAVKGKETAIKMLEKCRL